MRKDRMPQAGKALLIGFGASLTLAGCAAESVETAGTRTAAAETAPAAGEARPGAIRTGAQISGMAGQYAGPRPGGAVATGASAWVPAAPPPAFVVTQLPPAAPPAPPPAAVQNRQPAPAPAPRPAADASQVVRPEAEAPESPAPAASAAPALSAATRDAGRRLFATYSCGTCHALADAGAGGAIAPSLDNPTLTRDFVIDVVTTGRGAMPSFDGQMSDQEIATLADYIVGAARR